jgi:hypothetical protein
MLRRAVREVVCPPWTVLSEFGTNFGLAMLLALRALPMSAADAAEAGQNIGIGTNLCAEFAEAFRKSPGGTEEVYWRWAMGMMSGLNFASVANNKYFRDLAGDQELFRLAIRDYCERHPLATYEGAILDLYVSLPLKKAAAN